MGNLQEDIGRRLRALRVAAKLSQPELAKRAGMDHKFISTIETGARNLTVRTLERLLRALNVEPYKLWTADQDRPLAAGKVDVVFAERLYRKLDRESRHLVLDVMKRLLQLSVSNLRRARGSR